jgi:hypothetical protein
MSLSSKGYTSSFRGSVAPGAYAIIQASDFGTAPGPGGPVDAELGVSALYALLAYSGVTNTGSSVINGGNVGSAPTETVTGFPPGTIAPPFGIDNADAAAARTAGEAAYTHYAGLTFTSLGSAVDLSTSGNGSNAHTYVAGNYSSSSSMDIPTSITLDGQGNPNATFIFFAASTVTLESGASILLINGAKADNVIWLVGSSFTSVATSNMVGNILAYASITLGGGTLAGRALAVGGGDGAVTISAATVVNVPLGVPGVPGVQNYLPLIPSESTTDYIFIIPNTGSEWKVQKSVNFARPNGTTETAGVEIDTVDCIQPEYPGTSAAVLAGTTPASFFVMNGYGFQATTSGTTASSFIGFANFKTAKGATTTDGSVVWTALGKVALIRARFANLSASPATPAAQEYDFWEQ